MHQSKTICFLVVILAFFSTHVISNHMFLLNYINILSFCSTFVCPTEIIAFSDRADEFHAINCKVLACSVDSEFSHLAWYVLYYLI